MKKVAGILGAVCIFIGICDFLNVIYVSDREWEGVLWKSFYKDSGKIENLYLGSSHVYCDIDPACLDELNGQYNFNLASSAQLLNGSYYLLQEAVRLNPVSHVYLELYYVCSTRHDDSTLSDPINTDYINNWINIDCMQNSYCKLAYMFSNSGPETYVETVLPFCRYRAYLNDWNHIAETIESKKVDRNLPYRFPYEDGNGYVEYREQGYYCNTRRMTTYDERICWQERVLNEKPMGEQSEEYLRKIITYCQKKEIPLTLFISPIRDIELISTEHYDNYVVQIREIAEEYGIAFYDFNLTKEEYLPIQDNEYFFDYGHLNMAGAHMFTPFFYKVVSGAATDNEEYFYDSYAEKLQTQPFTIYGLYRKAVQEEENYDNENEAAGKPGMTYWVASNRDKGVEYKIVLQPDEGIPRTVQNFAENKEFVLHGDEHGICTIYARMKDKPEEVQTLEVKY